MARKAREISPIGYYSIRLRTDTCQFSQEDRMLMLDTLEANSDICGVLAYLLLPTIMCFVIKVYDVNISTLMRKVLAKYIVSYKKVHENTPKEIFKDRFISSAAHEVKDVFSYIGKLHNLGYLGDISISSCSNYFYNVYIDLSFFNEYCSSKEEFARKCNLINYEAITRKVSDEDIKNYLTNVYKVSVDNIKNMPKNTIVEMLTGVVEFTDASSAQIKRITKLPVNFLHKTKKEIIISKILKNKGKLKDE